MTIGTPELLLFGAMFALQVLTIICVTKPGGRPERPSPSQHKSSTLVEGAKWETPELVAQDLPTDKFRPRVHTDYDEYLAEKRRKN